MAIRAPDGANKNNSIRRNYNKNKKSRLPATLVSLDSAPYDDSSLAPSLFYPGGRLSVLVQVQVRIVFCFWQMSIFIRKRTSRGLWCCWIAQAQQKRRISRLGQQSTYSYSEHSCKLWNFHQLNWLKCWYKLWFLWKKAGVWGRDSLLVFIVTDEAATEKVFEHPRARNHPFTVALIMVSFVQTNDKI